MSNSKIPRGLSSGWPRTKNGKTTMNAITDTATQVRQSWLAGPLRSLSTGAAAAPSWLAPHALASINATSEAMCEEDPTDNPAEAIRQSLVEISLLPPATPVISLAPEAPAYPDLREENAQLRRTVEALSRELTRVKRDVVEATEPEMVRLACAVAERIVGQELTTDPGHIIAWAREGIEAMEAKEQLVIAISADLVGSIPADEWESLGTNVSVETDASLPAFSCELRTRSGSAKIGPAQRMAQVAGELGVAEPAR